MFDLLERVPLVRWVSEEKRCKLEALQADGWVYIDRRNRRIGKAMVVDSLPDENFGGYARFQAANGKIGFLDRQRRIVSPARYDAAFPFRNCRAVVCVGCHPLRWSKDAPEEAACTGDAFLIDESGKKLESSAGAADMPMVATMARGSLQISYCLRECARQELEHRPLESARAKRATVPASFRDEQPIPAA